VATNDAQSARETQPDGGGSGSGAEPLRRAIAEAFGPVRRYMYLQCGTWHEAEDVAQEALLRAWRSRDSFDGRAEARTWIFTIARNHWRDRLRRKRSRPQVQPMTEAMELPEASPTPHAAAARSELCEAVRLAVAALPAEQREALALREGQGLKFRQVAAVLEIPIATAKSRVRYALLKLADELSRFRPEAQS